MTHSYASGCEGARPTEPQRHLRSPDLDGRAAQNLPVAVPGAAGDGAAARGAVATQLPQSLLPAAPDAAVLVLRRLRHKLELLDAIDFDESEVKLPRDSRTETCPQRCCAGGGTAVGASRQLRAPQLGDKRSYHNSHNPVPSTMSDTE